jgi:hypothetical protein
VRSSSAMTLRLPSSPWCAGRVLLGGGCHPECRLTCNREGHWLGGVSVFRHGSLSAAGSARCAAVCALPPPQRCLGVQALSAAPIPAVPLQVPVPLHCVMFGRSLDSALPPASFRQKPFLAASQQATVCLCIQAFPALPPTHWVLCC